MPTIAFSDNFLGGSSTTVMGRIMQYRLLTSNPRFGNTGLLGLGSNYYVGHIGFGSLGSGVLSIMKGTVPTNVESITSYSSRSADVLVQWTIASDQFSPSSPNANPAVINTTFTAATASGTATWFWWVTRGYSTYTGWSDTIYEQIVGTVGELATGNDLEVPSTTVTSGQLFRVLNLRVQLPTSYTY